MRKKEKNFDTSFLDCFSKKNGWEKIDDLSESEICYYKSISDHLALFISYSKANGLADLMLTQALGIEVVFARQSDSLFCLPVLMDLKSYSNETREKAAAFSLADDDKKLPFIALKQKILSYVL